MKFLIYLHIDNQPLIVPQKTGKTAKGGIKATQKSSPSYPAEAVLCSCCNTAQRGYLPHRKTADSGELMTLMALEKKTSCTDSVLCTATQVVVLWQFFMNKKAQWAGSHCNKPCNALAVFSHLMAGGSQKESYLGCVWLIKQKVRQHCCCFSLVLLGTFISFLQNSPEAYQRVTAYRANLEYHKR